MKIAKRRFAYPVIALSADVQQILDAEIEAQGFSSHPQAMAAWSAWLKRSIAFERKRATGKK